jgi:MFS family permease
MMNTPGGTPPAVNATASPTTPIAAPAPEPTVKNARVGALQSRNFRLLWTGLLISNSGSWMATTAEGWLVTDLAKNNASLIIGMIAVAFALPMFGLTMVGGAIADRFPRKRMLWIVQFGYLTFASALAFINLMGWIEVWMLIVYSFLNGMVLAFDSPARNSLLPDIVDREHLSGAVSLNSAAYSGAALIGPAIAGALIPLIGVGGVYTINAFSGVAVLFALYRMKDVPEYVANRPTANTRIWASIKEGLRFAVESPIILGVLLVSIVSGIFARSYSPLLVIFAREEFHVGSFAFGLMVAAPGIGTLAAAFVLASRKDTSERGKRLQRAVSGIAVVLICFAVMPWYVGGLPLLVLAGFFATATAATMATIIQLQAPPYLRGRLMSIYMLTLIAVPSLGTLLSGAIADVIGVRETVGIAAVIMLIGVNWIFYRNRQLREVS